MTEALRKALAAAKASRAARANKPKTPAPPAGQSAAEIAAEARTKAVEAQLAALLKKTEELDAGRTSDYNAALKAERIAYATRAGIKLTGETLARTLPDADPRTPAGALVFEKFKTDNPDLYNRPAPKPADITKEVMDRITAKSMAAHLQPISERKLFSAELVRATLAKNLGGE